MRVSACPECAGTDLRLPGVLDGGALGGSELMVHVCAACGFRGAPVVFDDAAAYAQFRAAKDEGVEGGDDGTEEPDPRLAEELAAPSPGRPRGTAVFIGVLGVPMAAFGGFTVLGAVVVALAGKANLGGFVLGLVSLGLGLAFLRIAARMWRGG